MTAPPVLDVAQVRWLVLQARVRRPLPHVLIDPEPGARPRDDDTACLLREDDGTWFVGYFERGGFQDVRRFASEGEACRDFLEMVDIPVES